MKKYIYITGILSANLMLFGAIFKVMHWPGAGILLTLSILIFCFLFFPFALYNAYQNSSPRKYKLLYIVTYIVFTFVFIGALFKVMHWPGASWFLIIGIPLPMVVFLPVYLIQTRKDKKYSMVNFMGIMFGLTFLTVFSAMLSINNNTNVLLEIENQFKQSKSVSEAFSKYPESTPDDIQKTADDLCEYIKVLQNELLLASGNLTNEFQSDIMHFDDNKIAYQLFFEEKENSPLNELKNKMNEFKVLVNSNESVSLELKQLSNDLLNIDDKSFGEQNNYKKAWENYYFRNTTLIVVLEGLSRLERNVRFIEGEV